MLILILVNWEVDSIGHDEVDFEDYVTLQPFQVSLKDQ